MPTTTTAPEQTTAELISQLTRVSNNLANAAYYLEHPEIYNDETRSVVASLIEVALWQADHFGLTAQYEALKAEQDSQYQACATPQGTA